ncbi:ead/Ea22-like family protein [Salmonella enterica]|nr:ead/Ea22-like family protein [Salmonella enterica]EDL3466775.1 ead/Ea22-like family protein [Salmonella enterica]EGN6886419.1 ead/Ea22-like family protein [Salmonella enterica]
MSNIDKQALREAAEKATRGPWEMERENIWFTDEDGYTKHLAYVQQGDDVDDKQDHYNTAFIAAANPATMLALLDELEHYKSREERATKLVLDNSTSWDVLYEKLEAAERRIANNERVMRAVVEAASIRGIRPFEGIECDPPTLEENAEACGDAMSARIRELEANPPKPHHNGLMQISNELVQARQRIAELEKGHQEAAKQINSWRRLAKQNIAERGKDISELEAARQRIAELEARVIVLPQRLSPEGYHIDEAYMVDDTEGEYLDRDAVIDAIRAAGIKVKG